MANPNPKIDHLELTQWKRGKSGNPEGRPVGSKNIATYIREMLEDDNFNQRLKDGTTLKGKPIVAIIRTAIAKAISGDPRSMEWLFKYGYSKIPPSQDHPNVTVKIVSYADSKH